MIDVRGGGLAVITSMIDFPKSGISRLLLVMLAEAALVLTFAAGIVAAGYSRPRPASYQQTPRHALGIKIVETMLRPHLSNKLKP